MAELKISLSIDPKSVSKIQETFDTLQKAAPKIELKIDAQGLQGIEKNVIGLTKEWIKYQEEVEKTKRAHERSVPSLEKTKQEYEKTRQQVAKAVQENQKYQASLEKTIQSEERTKQSFEKTRQAEEKTRQEELKLEQQHEKTARAADTNKVSHNHFIDTLTRMISVSNLATTALTTAISKVRSAFNEALTTMKEVDTAVTHYRQVTGATAEEGQVIASQAYEIASQYGQAASDYVEAVATYARAGYAEQSAQLAELSMKTQIAGQTTAEVADQFLLTMDAAYKYKGSVTELTKVLDGAAKIDSSYATTVEKIAAGLGLVAPLAEQVHVTEAELTSAIGTITAATQRSGAEAARSLRSLFLNIIGDTTTEIEDGVTATEESVASVQYVLEKYAKSAVDAARATGEVIDPMKAIEALAQSMKDGLLTEAQMMDLLSGIGGKLRISQLVALISNWDMYTNMMEDYGAAVGDADKKVTTALESWEYKTNVLKNTFAAFVSETIDSGFVKGFIEGLTNVIKLVGNLGNALLIVSGIIAGIKLKDAANSMSQWATAMQNAGNTAKASFGNIASNVMGAVGAITSIMSVAFAAYNALAQMKEQEIKERQAAVEKANLTAEAAQTEATNLMTLYATFNSVESAYESGTGSVEEYDQATRNLAEALEIEGSSLDDVRKKIKEKSDAEIQAMLDEAQAQANMARATARTSATGAMKDLNTRYYGADLPNGILESIQYIYGISDYVDKTGEAAMQRMLSVYHQYQEELAQIAQETNGLSDATAEQTARYEQLSAWLNLLPPELLAYEEASNRANEVAKMKTDLATNSLEEYVEAVDVAGDESKNTASSVSDLADELKGVEESSSKATEAIEKFKESTKVQLDDNFKGYAEIWKSAMDDIEKGFNNSVNVQAAAKALFGDEFVEEARKQGISAAELINNDFLKKVYTFDGEFTGGEDAGSLLAYELYENYADAAGNIVDENGNVVASFEEVDGALSMSIANVEGFAAVMANLTGLDLNTEWWAAFIEATNQYGPETAETVWNMAEAMGVLHGYGNTRFIDEDEFREAAKAIGFTDEYVDLLLSSIRDLNEASEELANDDYDIDYHANTDEAQEKVESLTNASETFEKGSPYTATVTVTDQASSKVWEIKSNLDNLARNYTANVNIAMPYATGTKNARGGVALVNEEGPEVIKEGNRARVAGNGKPTLTWLSKGATVYNASESRHIMAGAGLSQLNDGVGAYATGITRWGSTSDTTGTDGTDGGETYVPTSTETPSDNSSSAPAVTSEEDQKNYLTWLKNVVAWRKSELELSKSLGESEETQSQKRQAVVTALQEEKDYMKQIQSGEEDWVTINNLSKEILEYQAEETESKAKAEAEAAKAEQQAQDEKLNRLKDIVSWRKSELELSEEKGESEEVQAKKRQDYIDALKEEKNYLSEIQDGEKDWVSINNLSKEILQTQKEAAEKAQKAAEEAKKAEEEAAEEAKKKAEEAAKAERESYADNVSLLKSELNVLQSKDASVDKQIAKEKEIANALLEEITYLRTHKGDQEEINGLLSEYYNTQKTIANMEKSVVEEQEQKQKEKQEKRLTTLESIVSLHKSELSLIQSKNGSTEEQIAKQREIQKDLLNQIKYMTKIGADQTEINNLWTEYYNIGTKIKEMREKEAEDTEKEREKAEKEAKEAYDNQIDKFQSQLKLRKSQLDILEEQDASVSRQVKKYEQMNEILQKQIEFMMKNNASQTEINALILQQLKNEKAIESLYDSQAKKREEKQKERQKELEGETSLLKSELSLMQAHHSSVSKQVQKQREIIESLKAQRSYLKRIGGSQEDINKLTIEILNTEAAIDKLLADEADNKQKKIEEKQNKRLEQLKAVVDLRKSELSLIEAQDGTVREQIQKERQVQAALQKQIDYMKSIGAEQTEINSLVSEWYSIEEKISGLEQGLLSNLKAAIEDKIDQLNEKRDAAIDKVQEQIDKLKEARSVQSDQLELEEKQLAVEEARRKLENALSERKVRVYNAAKGRWEWAANAQNVASAREALTNARQSLADYKDEQKFNATIEKLEQKQQAITDKYAEKTDQWTKVLEAMEEPVMTIAQACKQIAMNATRGMSDEIDTLNALLKPLGIQIGKKSLYDSGGVLGGIGGIKATMQDEMVLPPDLTRQMLSPIATSSFANRLNELRYLYGMSTSAGMAGSVSNSIGVQNNGGQYTFGDITMTQEQAKHTTVYDLANLSRSLRSYSSSL